MTGGKVDRWGKRGDIDLRGYFLGAMGMQPRIVTKEKHLGPRNEWENGMSIFTKSCVLTFGNQ